MPQFSYKARRKSGEVVQGVLEVADRAAALVQIERLGLFPVMVEGARGAATANATPVPTDAKGRALLPASMKRKKLRRPKLQELGTYTQQLANFRQDTDAANALLKVGESPLPEKSDPAELAAMTAVANVLLNLNETITK